MKVLFLTNIPSPYRIDFFNELGKHCDLTVWFEARNEANREWKIEGIGSSFRYKFLSGFTLGLDKHVNFSILRELRAESFDVYILGCYSSPTEMMAIQWLKARKKRFILNSDGGYPSGDRWFMKKLKTYLISSADLWLSSGTNCTKYLRHYGARPERIREYPLSSVLLSEGDTRPLTEREKAERKREAGLRGTVVLAVGQFIRRKGFDVLIEAFARLRGEDASLLLIGGGPEREPYERRIQELGLRNVVIQDFMQTKDLLAYWKLADLFVFPTRFDVWGLVLNEALAFGLPIVSTTMAGAAHDLVREGANGYLVPPDDVELLAERCRKLIGDAELRLRFGERSREFAAGYTLDRMVSSHLRILGDFAMQS